jgi:hypothetical protein
MYQNRRGLPVTRVTVYNAWMSSRVVLLSLLTFTAPVQANPAPLGGPGSGPAPLGPETSTAIALKEARVTITDGVKMKYPSPVHGGGMLPLHAVGYAGTYVLKNLGDNPRTVKVGFPTATAILGAGTPEGDVRNVKVIVDGKRIKHKVVTREIKGTVFRADQLPSRTLAALKKKGLARVLDGDPTLIDLAGLGREASVIAAWSAALPGLTAAQREKLYETVTRHYSDPDDLAVESVEERWYTFTLRIKPAQSREVKLSYQSPRGDARIVAASSYSFTYTMRTGARWSGPIDHYRLELVLETRRPLSAYVIRPGGFKRVKPRRLVLERRRFVPRDDLVVRVKKKRPR